MSNNSKSNGAECFCSRPNSLRVFMERVIEPEKSELGPHGRAMLAACQLALLLTIPIAYGMCANYDIIAHEICANYDMVPLWITLLSLALALGVSSLVGKALSGKVFIRVGKWAGILCLLFMTGSTVGLAVVYCLGIEPYAQRIGLLFGL